MKFIISNMVDKSWYACQIVEVKFLIRISGNKKITNKSSWNHDINGRYKWFWMINNS